MCLKKWERARRDEMTCLGGHFLGSVTYSRTPVPAALPCVFMAVKLTFNNNMELSFPDPRNLRAPVPGMQAQVKGLVRRLVFGLVKCTWQPGTRG